MVAYNTVLLNPESGWKRIEESDSNFVYIGTWGERSNTAYSGGSQKTQANTILGNKIQFNFYGTKIRVINSTHIGYTNSVKITIDGLEEYFSLSYSTGLSKALVYEKTGLPLKNHTVTVEKMSNAPQTNDFFWDAIDIDDTGIIGTYNINKILLLSNDGKVESFTKGVISNTDVIPKMTSNTAPNGVVSASGYYSSFLPYMAFDNVYNGNGWYAPVSATNAWLDYQFTNKKIIAKYSLRGNSITRLPKNWTFEGSNDGVNYTVLDTRVNINDWVVDTPKEFSFDNNNYFLHYRINITSNNGDVTYLIIGEMEMFEKSKGDSVFQLPSHSEKNFSKYGTNSVDGFNFIYANKNYILQDTVSENEDGLWTTRLNRKPLSIRFD